MPRYKVTFSFISHVRTPTESYISGDETPSFFLSKLQNLIAARTAILPKSALWLGVRIGRHNEKRRSKILRPGVRFPFSGVNEGLDIPSHGGFDDTTLISKEPNIGKVSLLMDRTFDVDRSSKAYLALVPDSVVRTDEVAYYPAGDPVWAGRLETYNQVLVENGWVIFARTVGAASPNVVVTGWINAGAAPSLLGARIPAGSAANFVEGAKVIVRNVRRKGTDRTSYNGSYTVDNVNTTLQPGSAIVFLQGTEAGEAASIKKPGTIQVKAWDYYPILKSEPILGTSRKRGNSAAGLRGRSRKRDTLAQ